MADERKIRIGVLGTGRIAHDFITSLVHLRGGVVVAVGSRGEQTAKEFALQHNIPRAHGSYTELVKDAEVDLIYIATPNSAHHEHQLLALSAGKAVLCEKTFTTTLKEAQESVALAQKNNLFFMEANWFFFFPLVLKMQQFLKEGLIGDVTLVQADLGFKNSAGEGEGINDPRTGGGALFACGIYLLSLASACFHNKKPSHVSAHATLNSKTGVDDTTSIILSYEDELKKSKKMAVLTTSIVHWMDSSAEIRGTKGSIKLHGLFVCPTRMTLKVDGQEEKTFEEAVPPNPGHFNFPNSSGLVYEAQAAIDALLEGKKECEKSPLSLSLLHMEILDEIRKQTGLKFPYEK